LAAVGLLPKKIQELMQLPDPSAKKNEDCGSCCAVAPAPSGPSKVKNLESQEDFDKLIESGDQIGEFLYGQFASIKWVPSLVYDRHLSRNVHINFSSPY
jgi:hypothetical protein